MKPEAVNRNVTSSGSEAHTTFGISSKDQVHLIRILRSKLYTDKPLAVLREYTSNAWDEHIDASCPDKPIKVTLPSHLDPCLRIRDYGRGLSWQDIEEVYTKYGASTKRDDNTKVGSMGIGSKAAFSYSDTFTVTSYHDGLKAIYVAVLDETDMGRMDLMDVTDSTEPSGIGIMVPIKPQDVHSFRRTAKALLYYMRPRPDINIELDKPETSWEGEHGFWGTVYDTHGRRTSSWMAVMGCIPYRIDIDQIIQDDNGHTIGGPPLEKHMVTFLQKHSGVVYFDIGDVRISANREEVEYTEDSIQALKDKIRSMLSEMFKETIDTIRNQFKNPWDRRRQARFYEQKTGIQLPGDDHSLAAHKVRLIPDGESPKHFVFYDIEQTKSGTYRCLSQTDYLRIDAPFLLLKDMNKSLRLCVLDMPHVITLTDGSTWKQAIKELKKYLKAADLDGVPFKKMTDMTPAKPEEVYEKSDINPKHLQTYFQLKQHYQNTTPYSDNWNSVERTATDDDVFVIINRFVGVGYSDFFHAVQKTENLMGQMQIPMPTIYGIKSTVKRPVFAEDTPGITLREWRWKQLQKYLDEHPEFHELMEAQAWHGLFQRNYYGPEYNLKNTLKWLRENLDGRHSLVQFLSRFQKARYTYPNQATMQQREMLTSLSHLMKDNKRVKLPQKNLDRLYAKYPLLSKENETNGFRGLSTKESRDYWLHYIKLVDSQEV